MRRPVPCTSFQALGAALLVLSQTAKGEELEISGSAKIAASAHQERLLGAGHATLLELAYIDTHTTQLNHSLGLGAFGVMSSANAPANERATWAPVARFAMAWHVAGGESGFDGLLHVDFSHGARWPARGHGLVVRGGADLTFAGNQQYYLSSFRAPNLDAGYQYIALGTVFELSFRTSLLWDGRLRSDNSSSLNLPTTVGWGALLEAGRSPFWASMQFARGSDVSQVNMDVCSQAAGAWSLCVRVTRVTDAWTWEQTQRHLTTGTIAVGWAPL